MQKCAEAVAVWLVRCQVIEEQEKKLYCYAMESFVMFWSPMILALLLGTIMGRVKEGILVIIPFMMIRNLAEDIMQKKFMDMFDMLLVTTVSVHIDFL